LRITRASGYYFGSDLSRQEDLEGTLSLCRWLYEGLAGTTVCGMRLASLLPFLVLTAAWSEAGRGATYYVDARRGSDRNAGTEGQPLKTLAKAASLVQAGDTVRMHAGVYRESVTVRQSGTPERPIRFEPAVAATVVVTGADLQTDWRSELAEEGEHVYSTAWPHRFLAWNKSGTHPSDDYHRLIGRPEQVFVNGYLLRQVLSRDRLTRGTFFADLEGARLCVQAADNAPLEEERHQVEASVRSTLWHVTGDHVHTCGIGNGLPSRASAWGANGGISLSSSPHCVIERNLLVGNREGFQFREQLRTTPRIGQADGTDEWIWNHDQVIRSNVIAFNQDTQVGGWFDVRDQRHWPATLQQASSGGNERPPGDMAEAFQSQRLDGTPTGLSLEKLNLVFDGNLYAVQTGGVLFTWGTPWGRHRTYTTLDEVRAELQLESGHVIERLPFANYHARDFQLPADHPALTLQSYPQGEVPGVKLQHQAPYRGCRQ
jgi:hypothetical protein